MKIKTATATYTGGGIYIYYGQLENGLYFLTSDLWESILLCDVDTSTEEAQFPDHQERHTVAKLAGENYQQFWNQMLKDILSGCPSFDGSKNYSAADLENRFI